MRLKKVADKVLRGVKKDKKAKAKKAPETKKQMEPTSSFMQAFTERLLEVVSGSPFRADLEALGWPPEDARRAEELVPQLVKGASGGARGLHSLLVAVCQNVQGGRCLNAHDGALFDVALVEMLNHGNKDGKLVHTLLREAGERRLLNVLYMNHYDALEDAWLNGSMGGA